MTQRRVASRRRPTLSRTQSGWIGRPQYPSIGYRIVRKNIITLLASRLNGLKNSSLENNTSIDGNHRHLWSGAYWVEATMANGNTTRVVVWVADSVLVRKNLMSKYFFYTADAVTGELYLVPISNFRLPSGTGVDELTRFQSAK